MPLHEDDKKYSAFTTPTGLYEYNRLPQGLCNSPGSFMRMMTSIFGDQNLLVFAPDEETAFIRLKYSAITKLLFDLLKGEKRKTKQGKTKVSGRKLSASDWMSERERAFDELKASLVNTVVLAHPDFMLSTDASLDGIGQQNIVADALSRVLFVRDGVGTRLLAEPYADLLTKVKDVSSASVQNAFLSSSGCEKLSGNTLHMNTQSIAMPEVAAIIQSHQVGGWFENSCYRGAAVSTSVGPTWTRCPAGLHRERPT
ncbi:hypothetical protein LDENG_00244450 [Lucifuga dentata]|nr:hypothetical protein LDENG_00244450 [Lucifuga dentata]